MTSNDGVRRRSRWGRFCIVVEDAWALLYVVCIIVSPVSLGRMPGGVVAVAVAIAVSVTMATAASAAMRVPVVSTTGR